jgi:carbon storage regulator CsrA
MLVLSRKPDSSIHIGADIRVKILGIRGNQVKVGIEAPEAIPVWRAELPPKGQTSLELQTSEDRVALGREDPFEVLLVEDDPGHVKLICGAFSACRLPRPIDVAVAQTGERAAESLGMDGGQRPAASPGLVLLDLHLPRMTGLELLTRIRTDPFLHLTPVVVLSCANDDAAVVNCMDAGANAFVSKASDPGAFRTSIARIADFWGHECRVPR